MSVEPTAIILPTSSPYVIAHSVTATFCFHDARFNNMTSSKNLMCFQTLVRNFVDETTQLFLSEFEHPIIPGC
jgi:hypothetical protein